MFLSPLPQSFKFKYSYAIIGTASAKPRYHRSGTEVIYSTADGDIDDIQNSKTMSKESIASSQKCLPPPDTYLEKYEEAMMSNQQQMSSVDPSFQRNDELLYAAVGPVGTSGCENYSYHRQQQISTFGTVIPRNTLIFIYINIYIYYFH